MGSGSTQDTRSNRSCTSAVPAHEALYEVLAVRWRVADEGVPLLRQAAQACHARYISCTVFSCF
jgi:hypothetical protein